MKRMQKYEFHNHLNIASRPILLHLNLFSFSYSNTNLQLLDLFQKYPHSMQESKNLWTNLHHQTK